MVLVVASESVPCALFFLTSSSLTLKIQKKVSSKSARVVHRESRNSKRDITCHLGTLALLPTRLKSGIVTRERV